MVTTDVYFPPDDIQAIIDKMKPEALAGFYTPILTTSLFDERNEFFVRLPTGLTVTPSLQESLNRLIANDETTQRANRELSDYVQLDLPKEMSKLRSDVQQRIEDELLDHKKAILGKDEAGQIKEADRQVTKAVEASIAAERHDLTEFIKRHEHDQRHAEEVKEKKARLHLIGTADYKKAAKARELTEATEKIHRHINSEFEHYRNHELPGEVTAKLDLEKPFFDQKEADFLRQKMADITKGLKGTPSYHLTAVANGNA